MKLVSLGTKFLVAYPFLMLLGYALPAHAFLGKTFLLPRSQSIDAARQLVGWQTVINRDEPCTYWALAFTPEYMRSRGCGIEQYLLGGNTCFTFSGSLSPDRAATDILADYFGMPLDYKSTMLLRPVMSQFIVDFDVYVGLDSLCKGLYFRLHAPVVHANWDFRLEETVITAGTQGYPAGYMAAAAITRSDLPVTVEDVLEGKTTFGDLQDPLAYGKIFNREQRVGLADMQFIVGKNIVCDTYHAGLNLRLYAPTGNRVCSEFLFNPVIGNGHHWEAGVGFTGHYDTGWGCWPLSFYLDANVTHLFTTRSMRSYDFNNPAITQASHAACQKKCTFADCGRWLRGSRYMLIEELHAGSKELFVDVNGPAAPDQYQSRLYPAINKSTLCTKTEIPVQVDVALQASWAFACYEIDLGYGLWYRSAEKLVCRAILPSNKYALKGDAQVYGFTAADTAIALNATQHGATLHKGQGTGNFVSGSQLQNLNADSPAQAQGPNAATSLFNITAADAASFSFTRSTVQTSNPAVLLSDADINECSALTPRAFSQKIFCTIGRTWRVEECCIPFLGIGGEFEWASTCIANNSAISQWGVWLKGGFSC